MTVGTHPASHRRSFPPPAARRNTSAMSAQGYWSCFDRRGCFAPEHLCSQNRPPSSLSPPRLNAAGHRRLAREPSAFFKSP